MPSRKTFPRSQKILLAVLALLLVGAVGFAIRGEKPWGKTVSKRLEKHQELQPKEYAVIGLWWGAVANAGVLALLLGTARWWVVEGEAQRTVVERKHGRPSLMAWALLGVTLGGAAWLRAPRLDHSLWNDEEYAMRKFAHGAWEKGKDGSWDFEPVSWTDTLFENRNGNNHLLNSLITREALTVWRAVAHAPRDAFSEVALRMPAFVAGLLTLGMVFLIGRRLASNLGAGDAVGLGAALLLALCPWHIRYAVEAKGYSFMLLFVCTAIYSLIRAMEEGRLRWWLLFAFSEAAFLLSFAGAIYVAAALNGFAAVELLRERYWRRLRVLIAFNLLAMIPVLQWMLPSVPQLLHYLHSEGSLHLGLGWPWLRDFFSGLAIGFQYDNPDPAEHAGTSWLMESAAHGWLMPLMIVAGLLVVAGAFWSLCRGNVARLAISAPLAAVAAAYIHNASAGTPMVVWYLLYAIIPAALAVPWVLASLVRGRAALGGVLPSVVIALFAAVYGLGVWHPGRVLSLHPRQPMREAVASAHAGDASPMTAIVGVSDRQIQSYDPKVMVLGDRPELTSLVTAARLANKLLFVYVCGRDSILQSTDGKLHAKLPVLDALEHGLKPEEAGGSGATFVQTGKFPGTEAMFSYRVYRLNP